MLTQSPKFLSSLIVGSAVHRD